MDHISVCIGHTVGTLQAKLTKFETARVWPLMTCASNKSVIQMYSEQDLPSCPFRLTDLRVSKAANRLPNVLLQVWFPSLNRNAISDSFKGAEVYRPVSLSSSLYIFAWWKDHIITRMEPSRLLSSARSKLSTRSFHESLIRPRRVSGSGDNGHSKDGSNAGSSSDHAKKVSKSKDGKYNRVNISDLLFDSSPTDKSGKNICTINNCNRKFVSKESMEAHQRRAHAPPTAHICSQCFASFSSVPNLNKHVCNAAFKTLH